MTWIGQTEFSLHILKCFTTGAAMTAGTAMFLKTDHSTDHFNPSLYRRVPKPNVPPYLLPELYCSVLITIFSFY